MNFTYKFAYMFFVIGQLEKPIEMMGQTSNLPLKKMNAPYLVDVADEIAHIDPRKEAGGLSFFIQRVSSVDNLFDQDLDWFDWNHMAFVKKGSTKEIWINGELLIRHRNLSPLPTDFTHLVIGANQNGNESHHGYIDDFAVFANALTEEEINSLAGGTSPSSIRSIVPVSPGGMVAIARSADGNITIEFTGMLESADAVSGPYSPIAGATSPFSVNVQDTAKFYRAR